MKRLAVVVVKTLELIPVLFIIIIIMFQNFPLPPGGVISKQDMFTKVDDTAKGVADGHDRKYIRKTQKNNKVTEIVTNFNTLMKHTDQQKKSPCQIRSCAKLSTSLENLEQPKPSGDRLYCAQEPVCKVPRSYLRHREGFTKKWPSTPNLNTSSEQNWRYWMMEKTIPNMHLKKTGLTEQMNKYQKYSGQSAGQTQRQENSETVVRRRPRKTIQKIRPKSEVRERKEEEDIDRDRRRPLSYIEGTKEKDFYIQTCKKPVMFLK
jgi:hypothetical protein